MIIRKLYRAAAPAARAVSALVAVAASAVTGVTAAVVPRITLEEMTGAAEVIVLGRVERAEAAWSDDGRIIVTQVEVAVERAIHGGPRARVGFEVPGGRIGEQILVASGAPVFRAGDRVVLFLGPQEGGGGSAAPGRLAIIGWNQGAIRVERDRATGRDLVRPQVADTVRLDRDGKPVREAGAGVGPWALDRFLDEVVKTLERRAGPGQGGGAQ